MEPIKWFDHAGLLIARRGEILTTICPADGRLYYAICDLAEQPEGIYKDTSSFDVAKMMCEYYLKK